MRRDSVFVVASVVVMIGTVNAEYLWSKVTRSSSGNLVPPCAIKRQNTAYNMVFLGLPSALLFHVHVMAMETVGATWGLLPVLQACFALAVYGIEKFSAQHYTLVLLFFLAVCAQLYLVDLVLMTNYTAWLLIPEVVLCVAIVGHKFVNSGADSLDNTAYNTANTIMIWVQEMLVWCMELVYIMPLVAPNDTAWFFWYDVICSGVLVAIMVLSLALQACTPGWRVWRANDMQL